MDHINRIKALDENLCKLISIINRGEFAAAGVRIRITVGSICEPEFTTDLGLSEDTPKVLDALLTELRAARRRAVNTAALDVVHLQDFLSSLESVKGDFLSRRENAEGEPQC